MSIWKHYPDTIYADTCFAWHLVSAVDTYTQGLTHYTYLRYMYIHHTPWPQGTFVANAEKTSL